MTGNYHSIFKGQGIEFSEIREYTPGDDTRTIDWNVTARFNHPFVKEFIEERDLNVYFAFDISASGSFGNLISKKRKAIELIASLMFAALRNNDNIGLFLFTDRIENMIPARKGKKHLLKTLSTLIKYKPVSKTTNLLTPLAEISKIVKKRSILFIISDFYSKEFAKPLKILKNKHDIITINVSDKREYEIPNIGLIELEDEETGEQLLIDTSDELFRTKYSKIIKDQQQKLITGLRKLKIDFINILTDEPYDIPLKKFLKLGRMKE